MSLAKSTLVRLTMGLCVLPLAACGRIAGSIDFLASTQRADSPVITTLELELVSPASSPSNDPTPTIRIGGLHAGAQVRLFTDASCSTHVAAATATEGTVEVMVASALTDGNYDFYARAHSASGVESPCSGASVSYLLDSTPPSMDSFSIEAGANTTTSADVALDLAASGAPSQMYLTNTADCSSGGTWETYSTTKAAWSLAQTNATVSVHVKVRDAVGNESACLSDSITHDDIAPSAPANFDDEIVTAVATSSSFASWEPSTENGSGLARYEIAIGTAPGGTTVLPWTDIGTVSSQVRTGLALIQGTTYYTSVRAIDNAGNSSSVAQGDGWVPVPAVTVAARYPIAPSWNDYAKTADTSAACAGTENGYFQCLHGGEARRVPLAAAASCAGYQISDLLGAFDWSCDDSGGAGNVYFYSKTLNHSKGLGDLVAESAWKDNRVLIMQGATPVAASERSAWWANTVAPLPESSTAGTEVTLSAPGTIYTVTSTKTTYGGYLIPAATGDKIGIVILPGASLRLSALASATDNCNGYVCLFRSNISKFNWLEGQIEGPGRSYGGFGFMSEGKFHVIRRLKTAGFEIGIGQSDRGVSSSFVSQVVASDNQIGVRIKGPWNIYQEITAIHNNDGLQMGDTSQNNTFQTIVASNNSGYGIWLYSNTNATMTAVTVIGNTNYGLYVTGDTGGTYHNVLAQGNGTDLFNATLSSGLTYSQSAFDSVLLSGITSGKFTGNWVSSTAPTCSVFGGTNPGLVSGTCAANGTSNFVKSTANGVYALKGALSSDDAVNTTDDNGTGLFGSILDWLGFENPFRGWGSTTGGFCASGTCAIWDFRLDSTDTRFRNTTSNGVNQNAAFASGGACPAYLSGNVTLTSINSTPRTYLKNAIELLGTGGNNNGLCESNERCLYTPNFGAYQGDGDFNAKSCTIGAGGTVQNVTVFAY